MPRALPRTLPSLGAKPSLPAMAAADLGGTARVPAPPPADAQRNPRRPTAARPEPEPEPTPPRGNGAPTVTAAADAVLGHSCQPPLDRHPSARGHMLLQKLKAMAKMDLQLQEAVARPNHVLVSASFRS